MGLRIFKFYYFFFIFYFFFFLFLGVGAGGNGCFVFAICRNILGVTFKPDYFWGPVKILGIFWGIVIIGIVLTVELLIVLI